MIDKKDIERKAREYLGTPFIHQGRLKHKGVDCAGLCVLVLRELGAEILDVNNYKKNPDSNMFLNTVEANLKRKRFEDVEVGDFLIFSFESEPQHIAIVSSINPIRVIHSLAKSGMVVEHTLDKYWNSRVRGCFEYMNNKDR